MTTIANPPTVVVHPDSGLLAHATAARIITRLVDAQALRGSASIVLTGGGIGIAVLKELAAAPARDAVDWQRVDVWWGDERFLPTGDPERNETQARAALLDHIALPADRVHAMPASDGADGPEPEPGAARYAEELRAAADGADSPSFDVCLLGVGPDTHVASLFPEHPALRETGQAVVAVHDSPKPPPTRVSLTLPAIRASREVWLLASGTGKAEAVRLALAKEAGPLEVPAAGARGRSRTLFLLDAEAAGALPEELRTGAGG
ncbi:6-phosphogluconolactonase [Nocardiopsis ansamitocini]|uniref:6-phosphogluconolactonase n=1 Tax=Nocardiopsis ansamitocini TaxID=1670832 RepID=A0A9W6UI09_9ACTN|nr:6-phosphogluconolactonase [Nocardiopsis ansamitocini]GLU49441.1 6-phosphogluconolactonase [Nocardiopsis ansamitocini]